MKIEISLFDSISFGVFWIILVIILMGYLVFYFARIYTKKETNTKMEDAIVTIRSDGDLFATDDRMVGASSILGTRSYQQDRVGIVKLPENAKLDYCGLVCDGMGGMDDGDAASEYCKTEVLTKILEDNPSLEDMTIYYDRLIRQMDEHVYQFKDERDVKLNCGTTFVSVCIRNGWYQWASVGDSRIYVLEDNHLRQITRDHNYELQVEQLVRYGQLTPQEAANEKHKDALISFIGLGGLSLLDVSARPERLAKGSVLLLCSDGVTKLVSDGELENLLISNKDLPADILANYITSYTCQKRRKGQDNTSVVIMKI